MEIRDYVSVLRARRPVVWASVFAFVMLAALASLARPASYSAEARVLVSQADPAATLLGLAPVTASGQPDRALRTHSELIRSPRIAAIVARRAGGTEDELLSRLEVEPVEGSDILVVRARASTPERAAAVANAFAAVYVERSAADSRRRIADAVAVLERQREAAEAEAADAAASAPGAARAARVEQARVRLAGASEQIERLRAGAALELAGASVAAAAEPPEAKGAASGVPRDVLVGLAFGLAVGVAGAFVAEHFDTTVRDPARVASLGVGVLAAVPDERSPRNPGPGLALLREPRSGEAEAYRAARVALRPLARPGATVLLVTAAGGADGAAAAGNLALALAEAGGRVALVDADVLRPSLAGLFGRPPQTGLADVLAGRRRLSQVLQRVHENLLLVPAGVASSGAEERVAGSAMAGIMAELTRSAEWVLLAAPPALERAEAAGLAEWSDAAVLVLAAGRTREDEARSALAVLRAQEIAAYAILQGVRPSEAPAGSGTAVPVRDTARPVSAEDARAPAGAVLEAPAAPEAL